MTQIDITLRTLCAYLRAEADFNRSWARRIELALERERWANALEELLREVEALRAERGVDNPEMLFNVPGLLDTIQTLRAELDAARAERDVARAGADRPRSCSLEIEYTDGSIEKWKASRG